MVVKASAPSAPPPWATGLRLLEELWGAEPPPVLDEELRRLIMGTTPQGRVELLPLPAGHAPGDLALVPGVTKLDGRWFYAACCRELGVGPVVHDGRPDFAGQYRRARYRVRVTVPREWDHVGLLPCKDEDGIAWRYPCAPGEEFTAWADACEVHLALLHRWPVRILERILLTDGRRPLDAWRGRLLKAAERRDVDADAAARLRQVLRESIGALAERQPTRLVRVAYGGDPIDPVHLNGTVLRQYRDGPDWVIEVERPRPHGSLRGAHPELAAQVWARARLRVVTAALRLPRERLLAIRTDALYVTRDPGWEDDGRLGSFRAEWADGARPWPTEWSQLAGPTAP